MAKRVFHCLFFGIFVEAIWFVLLYILICLFALFTFGLFSKRKWAYEAFLVLTLMMYLPEAAAAGSPLALLCAAPVFMRGWRASAVQQFSRAWKTSIYGTFSVTFRSPCQTHGRQRCNIVSFWKWGRSPATKKREKKKKMQLREREEKLLLLHVSLSICSAAAPESAIWGVGSRLALRCFSPFIFFCLVPYWRVKTSSTWSN